MESLFAKLFILMFKTKGTRRILATLTRRSPKTSGTLDGILRENSGYGGSLRGFSWTWQIVRREESKFREHGGLPGEFRIVWSRWANKEGEGETRYRGETPTKSQLLKVLASFQGQGDAEFRMGLP
jgi:hypothetical protein